jgi:hypothetical protein
VLASTRHFSLNPKQMNAFTTVTPCFSNPVHLSSSPIFIGKQRAEIHGRVAVFQSRLEFQVVNFQVAALRWSIVHEVNAGLLRVY